MTPAAQTQDIIAAIIRRADVLERAGCDANQDAAGRNKPCPTPTFCAEMGCFHRRKHEVPSE